MKNMNENKTMSEINAKMRIKETVPIEDVHKKEQDSLQENIVDNNDLLIRNFIDALRIQISKLEPELNINNDLNLFEAVLCKIDSDHSSCEKLSKQNREIAKMIEANPRLMILLEELMKGTPIRIALAKSDLSNIEPDIDDEQYEDYTLAVAQTRDRKNEVKKQYEMRLSKCEKCGEVAQQFYHEMELDEIQIDDFVNFLERAIDTIFEANIDRNFIETMWKAYNYDKEVQNAKQQGVVEGKNTTISMRRALQSDGLTSFSSSGTKCEPVTKQGYIERLISERYS